MKKVFLLITLLCILNFTFLKAQTNKGKLLVGVSSSIGLIGTGPDILSLGYSKVTYKSDTDGFEESEPTKSISVNLLPKVGYFAVDNLALGLDISLALYNMNDNETNHKYSQTLLSIGPFVRYYIPTDKVMSFFEVGGSLGVLNNKQEGDDWDGENKLSVMSFGSGIGIAVPLGDRVTFDVMAVYNSLTLKDKEDNDDNYRTIYGTFGLKLGFIVLLGAN